MGNYFWIVILLVGAWRVVGSLIERAGKQQQEQRLRDLATQRQRQMAAPQAGADPTGRADPAGARVETLVTRRQAQLDELRNKVEAIDLEAAARVEAEVRHDVMAHVRVFADQCPDAAAIIHLGATSAFVTDNTDIIQILASAAGG